MRGASRLSTFVLELSRRVFRGDFLDRDRQRRLARKDARPQDPRARLGVAELRFEERDLSGARVELEALKDASLDRSAYLRAQLVRAACAWWSNDREACAPAARSALEKSRDRAADLRLVAAWSSAAGEHGSAIQALAAHAPSAPWLTAELGPRCAAAEEAWADGDRPAAFAALEGALASGTSALRAITSSLALIALSAGYLEPWIRKLGAALRRRPRDLGLRLALGAALESAGWSEVAAATLEEGRSEDVPAPVLLDELAALALRRGDLGRARGLLQERLALEAGAEPQRRLGVLLAIDGELRAAEVAWNCAAELDPEEGIHAAEIAAALGLLETSADLLERICAARPRDARPQYLLALRTLQAGRFSRAREALTCLRERSFEPVLWSAVRPDLSFACDDGGAPTAAAWNVLGFLQHFVMEDRVPNRTPSELFASGFFEPFRTPRSPHYLPPDLDSARCAARILELHLLELEGQDAVRARLAALRSRALEPQDRAASAELLEMLMLLHRTEETVREASERLRRDPDDGAALALIFSVATAAADVGPVDATSAEEMWRFFFQLGRGGGSLPRAAFLTHARVEPEALDRALAHLQRRARQGQEAVLPLLVLASRLWAERGKRRRAKRWLVHLLERTQHPATRLSACFALRDLGWPRSANAEAPHWTQTLQSLSGESARVYGWWVLYLYRESPAREVGPALIDALREALRPSLHDAAREADGQTPSHAELLAAWEAELGIAPLPANDALAARRRGQRELLERLYSPPTWPPLQVPDLAALEHASCETPEESACESGAAAFSRLRDAVRSPLDGFVGEAAASAVHELARSGELDAALEQLRTSALPGDRLVLHAALRGSGRDEEADGVLDAYFRSTQNEAGARYQFLRELVHQNVWEPAYQLARWLLEQAPAVIDDGWTISEPFSMTKRSDELLALLCRLDPRAWLQQKSFDAFASWVEHAVGSCTIHATRAIAPVLAHLRELAPDAVRRAKYTRELCELHIEFGDAESLLAECAWLVPRRGEHERAGSEIERWRAFAVAFLATRTAGHRHYPDPYGIPLDRLIAACGRQQRLGELRALLEKASADPGSPAWSEALGELALAFVSAAEEPPRLEPAHAFLARYLAACEGHRLDSEWDLAVQQAAAEVLGRHRELLARAAEMARVRLAGPPPTDARWRDRLALQAVLAREAELSGDAEAARKHWQALIEVAAPVPHRWPQQPRQRTEEELLREIEAKQPYFDEIRAVGDGSVLEPLARALAELAPTSDRETHKIATLFAELNANAESSAGALSLHPSLGIQLFGNIGADGGTWEELAGLIAEERIEEARARLFALLSEGRAPEMGSLWHGTALPLFSRPEHAEELLPVLAEIEGREDRLRRVAPLLAVISSSLFAAKAERTDASQRRYARVILAIAAAVEPHGSSMLENASQWAPYARPLLPELVQITRELGGDGSAYEVLHGALFDSAAGGAHPPGALDLFEPRPTWVLSGRGPSSGDEDSLAAFLIDHALRTMQAEALRRELETALAGNVLDTALCTALLAWLAIDAGDSEAARARLDALASRKEQPRFPLAPLAEQYRILKRNRRHSDRSTRMPLLFAQRASTRPELRPAVIRLLEHELSVEPERSPFDLDEGRETFARAELRRELAQVHLAEGRPEAAEAALARDIDVQERTTFGALPTSGADLLAHSGALEGALRLHLRALADDAPLAVAQHADPAYDEVEQCLRTLLCARETGALVRWAHKLDVDPAAQGTQAPRILACAARLLLHREDAVELLPLAKESPSLVWTLAGRAWASSGATAKQLRFAEELFERWPHALSGDARAFAEQEHRAGRPAPIFGAPFRARLRDVRAALYEASARTDTARMEEFRDGARRKNLSALTAEEQKSAAHAHVFAWAQLAAEQGDLDALARIEQLRHSELGDDGLLDALLVELAPENPREAYALASTRWLDAAASEPSDAYEWASYRVPYASDAPGNVAPSQLPGFPAATSFAHFLAQLAALAGDASGWREACRQRIERAEMPKSPHAAASVARALASLYLCALTEMRDEVGLRAAWHELLGGRGLFHRWAIGLALDPRSNGAIAEALARALDRDGADRVLAAEIVRAVDERTEREGPQLVLRTRWAHDVEERGRQRKAVHRELGTERHDDAIARGLELCRDAVQALVSDTGDVQDCVSLLVAWTPAWRAPHEIHAARAMLRECSSAISDEWPRAAAAIAWAERKLRHAEGETVTPGIVCAPVHGSGGVELVWQLHLDELPDPLEFELSADGKNARAVPFVAPDACWSGDGFDVEVQHATTEMSFEVLLTSPASAGRVALPRDARPWIRLRLLRAGAEMARSRALRIARSPNSLPSTPEGWDLRFVFGRRASFSPLELPHGEQLWASAPLLRHQDLELRQRRALHADSPALLEQWIAVGSSSEHWTSPEIEWNVAAREVGPNPHRGGSALPRRSPFVHLQVVLPPGPHLELASFRVSDPHRLSLPTLRAL